MSNQNDLETFDESEYPELNLTELETTLIAKNIFSFYPFEILVVYLMLEFEVSGQIIFSNAIVITSITFKCFGMFLHVTLHVFHLVVTDYTSFIFIVNLIFITTEGMNLFMAMPFQAP